MSHVKKLALAELVWAGILQRFLAEPFQRPPRSDFNGNRLATEPAAPFRYNYSITRTSEAKPDD